MAKSYSRDFKKMIVELINIQGHSTLKTAEEFNVPLKTLENWITAYNKDNHCFDPDYISPQEQIARLEKEKSLIINLIKDINISQPNQVWTTDITYIKLKDNSFVYLSSIIDLYSRKVIAWNIGTNMKTLVLETLENAFKVRGNPKNVIIHSDKGSQYRSQKFREAILKHHCLFSYTSLNHSCDENANQESFHATLK